MTKPIIRVSEEFDEYLISLNKKTGLSKIACSKLLAMKLKSEEISVLQKKKKNGFKTKKFNFKI